MKYKSSPAGGKLLAHFVNTVYNDDMGQILDYNKKLTNHNKKKIQK